MTSQKYEGPPGPSREVLKCDHERSGADGTGQQNAELEWGKRNMGEDTPVHRPVRAVFRKTELHGTILPSTPDEKKRVRRRTLQHLKEPDAEVTYQQFESVFRHFVCSLMERQDRMNNEQYLHVAELQQQIDALEKRLDAIPQASPDPMVEKGRPG